MSAYWGDGYWGDGWWGSGVETIPAPDERASTPPLLRGTAWERAAFQGGARPIARLTVESGGGEPVELTIRDEDLEVTRSLARGTRWTAAATILREPGQDTEARVMTPGAIFRLEHGWDHGGGFTELRPFGVYQLAKIPTIDRADALTLELHDLWAMLSENQAIYPLPGADVISVAAVESLVRPVFPSIEIVANWNDVIELAEPLQGDVSRTNLISKMANVAGFYPHFDERGRFVIDPPPSQGAPVASLSDGENATLASVKLEAVYSTPYNCVVFDIADGASYAIHLADTSHPMHRSKPGMGVRPYRLGIDGFYYSAARIFEFGTQILSQLVGGIQRRTFSTWGRGDLNPGDWVSAIEAGTYLMPQRSSVSMVEEIRHNPFTVATEIVTRSTPRILTEEG